MTVEQAKDLQAVATKAAEEVSKPMKDRLREGGQGTQGRLTRSGRIRNTRRRYPPPSAFRGSASTSSRWSEQEKAGTSSRRPFSLPGSRRLREFGDAGRRLRRSRRRPPNVLKCPSFVRIDARRHRSLPDLAVQRPADVRL